MLFLTVCAVVLHHECLERESRLRLLRWQVFSKVRQVFSKVGVSAAPAPSSPTDLQAQALLPHCPRLPLSLYQIPVLASPPVLMDLSDRSWDPRLLRSTASPGFCADVARAEQDSVVGRDSQDSHPSSDITPFLYDTVIGWDVSKSVLLGWGGCC